ncbi:CRISPR-associated protein Cas5 family [Thermodesulfobacterium geofontis OPF15]|jgi:CRISPR-associated protein Cas5t|uniref:CRISPR-associated protein Cas5 family n=1 Tax=Thermodesulfobacterium geofontis (strain OPF15) TaxID=795359 RepID=F8C1Y0_THEGP|nr:type I-B CRISPR-associated protein Cas5b [Thermodesulfobacterium geofontis]AEH23308.1 CRISPR-associated protein Cas5 family [Thermodesulfobacterium geofontis OPF15]
MKVLKLKIYQPTAHYRILFTFARRHTYPIPPYSTVIGFICNVLGIRDQWDENFEKLKEGLSLAIYGNYEYLNREYVWFRTLDKDSHIGRFGWQENRFIDQLPEHPGGQIPTRVDVLENVKLVIYIRHEDENFIEILKNAFENPSNRIYPIHLGRAEDLVVFEEIKTLNIKEEKKPLYGSLKEYNFTWLVDPGRGEKYLDFKFYPENYSEFFNKIQGSYHLITSFYRIVEGFRVFEQIPVKLFEGGSFPLSFGKPFRFIFDEEENLPLFFTKMIYPEE